MIPALKDFEGSWQLIRHVRHADGARAQFTGKAVFAPTADAMHYTETGQLEMAGHTPMQAERRYIWQADAKDGLRVLFEDGRAFHQIGPDTLEARHFCDPDVYDVRYAFDAWPIWRCEWHVTGPRKAYVMDSHYQRLEDNLL